MEVRDDTEALEVLGMFIVEGFVHWDLFLPDFNERHNKVSKVAKFVSYAQVCARAEDMCAMWLSTQP